MIFISQCVIDWKVSLFVKIKCIFFFCFSVEGNFYNYLQLSDIDQEKIFGIKANVVLIG